MSNKELDKYSKCATVELIKMVNDIPECNMAPAYELKYTNRGFTFTVPLTKEIIDYKAGCLEYLTLKWKQCLEFEPLVSPNGDKMNERDFNYFRVMIDKLI